MSYGSEPDVCSEVVEPKPHGDLIADENESEGSQPRQRREYYGSYPS
jgi:hypothetical protein